MDLILFAVEFLLKELQVKHFKLQKMFTGTLSSDFGKNATQGKRWVQNKE